MNTVLSTHVVPLRPHADGYVPMIEAILFSAGKPVTAEQISTATGCPVETAKKMLHRLATQLETDDRGVCIAWVGSAAQLVPKPQYQQAIESARSVDTDRLTAVVDEFLHVQQVAGRAKRTIKQYRDFLTRFARWVSKPVTEITVRDIRMFLMAEGQRGNSRNTLATKTVILRSFFGWCEKDDLIDKDPMRKIEKPKETPSVPKYLTHEELERVREACEKPFERVLVELLYSSGLRVSEAVGLDWSDIDWHERTIKVRDGKGGKDREVPMSTRASLLLKKHQESRTDDAPYVIRSQFDKRMSTHNVRWWIERISQRAELSKKLTPHVFRHSIATHLLASGMPINAVQVFLGHASVATTEVYAQTQRASIDMYYRRAIS